MKTLFRILLLAALVPTGAFAQTSAFTYQGTLNNQGAPANGSFEMQFLLFDADTGGSQIGNTAVLSSVPVAGGLFHVSLDFGANAFDGGARWLEIQLRSQGSTDPFVTLTPRQTVGATPYALYAMTPAGPAGATGPQGPQGVAGPAGLTWRGNWNGSDSYAVNDAVQSGGSAWIALRANQNVQPVAGADWSLLAMKGDAGATGTQGPQGIQGTQGPAGAKGDPGLTFRGPWNFLLAYQTDDAVSSGGSTWIALRANVGIVPAAGEDWALLAQVGDMGPAGPQGATGPQGDQGTTGPQGVKGDTGDAGPTGPQGATGATGAIGPQGPAGLAWRGTWDSATSYAANDAVQANGSAWIALRANSNITPVAGVDWSLLAMKGDTGAAGAQGPQGAAGPQGVQGATGPQGVKGDTGDTGPTGPQGPQGVAGTTGATGPQGPAGLVWRGAWDGGTSYVASDAVLANGSAWVAQRANNNVPPAPGADWSLLAMKGDTGAQGPQGATGPQGAKGDTGDTGPAGPQGTQGATGATGPQGPAGLNWRGDWISFLSYTADDAVQHNGSAWVALRANSNVTPVAGADWSLLAMKGDTGATGAQGPQGATGPQGVQGATGPQGAKGDTGDTGPAGPQGPQGTTGATGATGPQGPAGLVWRGAWNSGTSYVISDAVSANGSAWIALRANNNVTPVAGADWSLLAMKGDTGATGAQGPQGATGPQGAQGATGPQGAKGDTGDTGPTGPQGPQGATGATGAQGPAGLTWRSAWDSGTFYVANDAVQSGGSAWIALQPNFNVTPVAGANWSLLAMKGDAGATGATGAQGATGPQGPQGATGAQGPQGAKGDTGDTGPTGSQGPTGATGATGATGPEGPQGPAASTNNVLFITSDSDTNDVDSMLQLGVDNNRIITLLQNGNVGIGKTNPASILDISGTLTATTFSGSGANLTSLNAANLSGIIPAASIANGSITSSHLSSNALASATVGTDSVGVNELNTTVGSSTANTTITNPTPQVSEQFGRSAAAAGNNQILVGAPGDNTGAMSAGSAYLYDSDGTLVRTFNNPGAADLDVFGKAVAGVGTDRVLIGAPMDDTGAMDAGSAYLYGTDGTLQQTINNPSAAIMDSFGEAVAAVGTDRLLIGAPGDATGAMGAGSAYLYNLSGTLLQTINNPTPSVVESFGKSVTGVGTDRIVIGAPGESTAQPEAGAVYVYDLNGTLLQTITNPAPVASGKFGSLVIEAGSNQILVGAPGNDAAYLYNLDGSLATTITNPVPDAAAEFGSMAVAVGTGSVVIGAPMSDGSSGIAHLFQTDGTHLITINNPSAASMNEFGTAAAPIGTDKVFISAVADDTGAMDAGAGHVIELQSNAVRELIAGTVVDGAITSEKIGGVLNATSIPNLDANKLTSGTLDDNRLSSAIARLTNVWAHSGNSGTTAGTHFVGTTDDQALEFKVNSQRALRLDPGPSGSSALVNMTGGHADNSITNGVASSVIAGGGNSSTNANFIYESFSFIGGGYDNTIGDGNTNVLDKAYAVIAGGVGNTANAQYTSVLGGRDNTASGSRASVVGGENNVASGGIAFVGGGNDNQATGAQSAVLGGAGNTASDPGAVVVGGFGNRATQDYSFVGGGRTNSATANRAGIVAGDLNTASGTKSFIGAGINNDVTGPNGTVVAGEQNTAAGGAFVGAGARNTATGVGAAVVGGEDNTASGINATVGGGDDNVASGLESVVAGGQDNIASGSRSAIGGGFNNTASGLRTTIPGGSYAVAANTGQMAYGYGRFAANGDAQTSLYVSREETTGSGFVIVTDGGVTDIPDGQTWTFSALIVGRSNDGKSGGYKIEGVIENVSSTVGFIGTPVVTVLGEDNASWDVKVTAGNGADPSSQDLEFQVNSAGDDVRWVVTTRISQVAY